MSLTDDEKRLIGGSDAAAIAGVHPNKTALDVWRRIVEGHELPDGPLLRRGRLMEPVIREMAREDFALKLLGPRKLRHRQLDFVRASLDDVHSGADGEEAVEFKSVSGHAARKWDDGEPAEYLAQVQFYMGVSGMPRARLVALIGVDDLREYRVAADLEVQSMLFEASEKFYRDHVKTRKPPQLDGSESCAEWLKERFPSSNGSLLEPTDEARKWADIYARTKAEREEAEAAEQEARNQLVAIIGKNDGIRGVCTYRQTKGRETVDWKAVCADAKVSPILIEKHSKRTPYRVFRYTGGRNAD